MARSLCSVNRAPTFEAVKKWKNDIDNKVMIPSGMIPTILLANKCDLLKDPVDKAELVKFCADNDFRAGARIRSDKQLTTLAVLTVPSVLGTGLRRQQRRGRMWRKR